MVSQCLVAFPGDGTRLEPSSCCTLRADHLLDETCCSRLSVETFSLVKKPNLPAVSDDETYSAGNPVQPAGEASPHSRTVTKSGVGAGASRAGAGAFKAEIATPAAAAGSTTWTGPGAGRQPSNPHQLSQQSASGLHTALPLSKQTSTYQPAPAGLAWPDLAFNEAVGDVLVCSASGVAAADLAAGWQRPEAACRSLRRRVQAPPALSIPASTPATIPRLLRCNPTYHPPDTSASLPMPSALHTTPCGGSTGGGGGGVGSGLQPCRNAYLYTGSTHQHAECRNRCHDSSVLDQCVAAVVQGLLFGPDEADSPRGCPGGAACQQPGCPSPSWRHRQATSSSSQAQLRRLTPGCVGPAKSGQAGQLQHLAQLLRTSWTGKVAAGAGLSRSSSSNGSKQAVVAPGWLDVASKGGSSDPGCSAGASVDPPAGTPHSACLDTSPAKEVPSPACPLQHTELPRQGTGPLPGAAMSSTPPHAGWQAERGKQQTGDSAPPTMSLFRRLLRHISCARAHVKA
ncbi:hypothetical protein V8C86DRAFT_2906363 [Haematococcus lacustris]